VYKIEDAYSDTAEYEYRIRDTKTRINSLIKSLDKLKGSKIPKELSSLLRKLSDIIGRVLK